MLESVVCQTENNKGVKKKEGRIQSSEMSAVNSQGVTWFQIFM